MPYCPECGHQLTGTEPQCPGCGQATDSQALLAVPSPPRIPESLPLKNYFKTGWELFKQYPGGFVGFCLLYLIIQAALSGIPYLGLVAAAVSTPLLMGNFTVSIKLLNGQHPEFGDFFAGFQYFLPLLLLTLVSSLAIILGTLLLIIPGVYLAVAYMFAAYLVIDRRMDFWPAMELSRHSINPRWFGFFGFTLLLVLLNLAGVLLLGVGLLVTIPLSFCVVSAAYADIFGLQAKES